MAKKEASGAAQRDCSTQWLKWAPDLGAESGVENSQRHKGTRLGLVSSNFEALSTLLGLTTWLFPVLDRQLNSGSTKLS